MELIISETLRPLCARHSGPQAELFVTKMNLIAVNVRKVRRKAFDHFQGEIGDLAFTLVMDRIRGTPVGNDIRDSIDSYLFYSYAHEFKTR